VVAIATVVNVIATLLLWLTTKESVNVTKEMFEASHRPYVHISEIEMRGPDDDDDDGDLGDEADDPALRKELCFNVVFNNVGSVPAHDVVANMQLVVDGLIMPNIELEDKPIAVLFPNEEKYTTIVADDPKDIEQIQKAKALSLIIKCTYKGVAEKQYSYEEKAIYDEDDGEFGSFKVFTT
jgi:hypothetical protein